MHTLTAYGHSWVQGDGATDRGRCLVSVVARGLGYAVDNRGVGGTLSTQTAELLSQQPPPPYSTYLLMTGLNDARLHGPCEAGLDRYASALRAVLQAFRAAGPGSLVVVVEQPRLADYSGHPPHDRGSDTSVDAYNDRLRAAARDHPEVLLVTAHGWNPATMLADDTVHPNDAGHAAIARAVLARLLRRPA